MPRVWFPMTAPTPKVDGSLVELLAGHEPIRHGSGLHCAGCTWDSRAVDPWATHLARVVQEWADEWAGERSSEVWWDRGRKWGASCVTGTRIPTAMVADHVAAEGGDTESAMEMWDLTEAQVQAAVAYEAHLDERAGERVAAALEGAAALLDERVADWRKDALAPSGIGADYGRWDAFTNAARIVRGQVPATGGGS